MRRIIFGMICLTIVACGGCGGVDNRSERPAKETPLPTTGPSGVGGGGAPAPPPPPALPN